MTFFCDAAWWLQRLPSLAGVMWLAPPPAQADQILYVGNASNGSITECDPSGTQIGPTINANVNGPWGLAFGSQLSSGVPEPSMVGLWCIGALMLCGIWLADHQAHGLNGSGKR
jgi:hypothetical protein